jgi:hypothetical protein
MAMLACDKPVTTIRRFVPKWLNGVQISGRFWLFGSALGLLGWMRRKAA